MLLVSWLLLLSGIGPLVWAWRANRRTSLWQALIWAISAWASWVICWTLAIITPDMDLTLARYLALCLSGCAGIAVLGARQPGVNAWNFVTLGLLAVLLLPVAEGWGQPQLGPPRIIFLAALLAVVCINYLPTRLVLAALLLMLACGIEILAFFGQGSESAGTRFSPIGRLLLALSPWLALLQIYLRPMPVSEFDRLWIQFRDRFGLLWAQRTREQFNRAAANAGWPVVLGWQGLHILSDVTLPEKSVQDEMMATLYSLLKRFRSTDP